MRICFLFISCLFSSALFAQTDSLYSRYIKDWRHFEVYLPAQYNPAKQYRLVLVLDGQAFGQQVFEQTTQPSIVVSLGDIGLRGHDYSPQLVHHASEAEKRVDNLGGAAHFSNYLQFELMPFLQKKFPRTKEHTILGHSLGGLFVLYQLQKYPALFQRYISLEASTWYDRANIDSLLRTSTHSYKNTSLYIATANCTNDVNMTIDQIFKSTNLYCELTAPGIRLAQYLATQPLRSLRCKWEHFPQAQHSSVTAVALKRCGL
ncbi:putative esterase [Chitinophaga skermanii]|uniref:Putative esterase n=1 Tax=Chitinophaga skermanii TaxID=331697 RepID=A0A327QCH7_9BACT|nr:alpha/beta hydrolase-fold protein [Chitinophaga skermanii]RAJ02356.1 putative esterase [Chitinophaga skermanii]